MLLSTQSYHNNCFLQFLSLVQIVVDSIQMLMSVAVIHVKMEPLVSMGTTTSCVYAQMALKDKDVKIVSWSSVYQQFQLLCVDNIWDETALFVYSTLCRGSWAKALMCCHFGLDYIGSDDWVSHQYLILG